MPPRASWSTCGSVCVRSAARSRAAARGTHRCARRRSPRRARPPRAPCPCAERPVSGRVRQTTRGCLHRVHDHRVAPLARAHEPAFRVPSSVVGWECRVHNLECTVCSRKVRVGSPESKRIRAQHSVTACASRRTGDAHRVVPRRQVARGAAHREEHLVVDRAACGGGRISRAVWRGRADGTQHSPRALEQLPVQRARREVERAGVDEHLAACQGCQRASGANGADAPRRALIMASSGKRTS